MQTKKRICVYDLETFKEVFIALFYDINSKEYFLFEISRRKNEIEELILFCKNVNILIGFNNLSFDWPVLRKVIQNKINSSEQIYKQANNIIKQEYSILPAWCTEINQIDLYKILHFDNKAKRTSLKWCEFFLRWPKLQDLPYSPNQDLNNQQIQEIVEYCYNDVDATYKLLEICKDKIKLRKILSKQYNLNLINANDPKIGSEIFASIISKELNIPIKFLKKTQTNRDIIQVKDLLLPYVSFESDEFNEALEYYNTLVIKNEIIKGVVEYSVKYNGFVYDFGAGGIHGSKTGIFEIDNNHIILDIDVAKKLVTINYVNSGKPKSLIWQSRAES